MASVLAAAPEVDELSFALAFAGVGAIVGQGIAAYRRERDADVNMTRIVFGWTAFGFVFGWLLVLF